MASYTLRNTYVVLYPASSRDSSPEDHRDGYPSWAAADASAAVNLGILETNVDGEKLTPSPGVSGAMLLKIGTGKISWTEAKAYEYDLERGKLDPAALGTATEGDDSPMSVSFDAIVEYYSIVDGTSYTSKENPRTVMAVDTETGCYPSPVDIAVFVNDCAVGEHAQFYIADFRWESLAYDPAAGTLSVSGQSIFPTAFVIDNA